MAAKKRSSTWITPTLRLATYIRDGFRCLMCGSDLRDARPSTFTLDHVLTDSMYAALTPFERQQVGDKDAPTNVYTCCRPCNSSRKDAPLEQVASREAYERIQVAIRWPVNANLAAALFSGFAADHERRTPLPRITWTPTTVDPPTYDGAMENSEWGLTLAQGRNYWLLIIDDLAEVSEHDVCTALASPESAQAAATNYVMGHLQPST